MDRHEAGGRPSDDASPPAYVDLETQQSDEAAALRLHQQLNEEERSFVPYVYGLYMALMSIQACDFNAKVWSIVCIGRGLLQLVHNVLITTLRLRRQAPPRKLLFSSRLLYLFGFSWWIVGFKVLLMTPGCEDEATLAETVSLILFWATAVVYAIPFFIYAVLCLFLPCIIYFIVRFAVRPADRQPTPQDILRQLQSKTYKDLLESLKRQYNIENDAMIESRDTSLLPSLSLENVLGGVSSLLGGNTGGSPPSPRSDLRGAPLGDPMRPQGPSISVNKCCPICMVDLVDDDTVLIMPCDPRHFFHQACVEHWLETSQACPICRANIVRLITGNRSPPLAHRDGGLELQV
ncbi:zinc c3hc4 type (ring finger) domain-containing protein [Cyclospora cayetanensis]|uniref:Zinc c3hc4 type (Ring finger) domain-containing protein n=1 Tax=Cyclospora cayetanensis TaxID=88456 RepID=A0A1D3CUL9_9EIME|nr:zinc c3hc4 type (ring finger) domain-containing protein [Cyclospora cayetanensis]